MQQREESKNVHSPLANVAAERAVLAGICKYGTDAYIELENLLDESTFTVNNNKILFKCVKHILKKSNSIDFATILSASQDLGLQDYVDKTDVLKHIRAILETPIHLGNVYENAAKIRRLQFGRDIQNKLRDIYRNISSITGEEPLASIIAIAEDSIQNLSLEYIREDQTTPKEIGANLDEYLTHLMDNPCTQIGISTGMPAFDRAIGGGLRRKCIDVIGARAKAGKSLIGDNVALNVAKQGIPVLVLDTEMSEEDHWNRMLACLANVPINEIGTGTFASDQYKKARVLTAKKELQNLPYYYISIAGRPFEETLSIIKRWLLKVVGYDDNSRMKDCLVVYDYLKLMSENELDDMKEYQKLGFQITKLHNLAVEYDFPCLTFTQLNRDGINQESAATVSGSDRIIWLCTSFSILKAKTEEEMATDGIRAGNRKLVPIVSRHGPGLEGSGYVCLQMEGEYARLRHLGAVKEIGRRQEFEKRARNPEEEDGEDLESSFS